MYRRPPQHNHGLLPHDLVGISDMELLTRHYRATYRSQPDGFEKSVKMFSQEERETCAELYKKLRDHGFYPDRIDANGKIVWGMVMKNDVQMAMEKYLPELHEHPDEEQIEAMKRFCRGAFRRMAATNDETIAELQNVA